MISKTYTSQVETMQAIVTGHDVAPSIAWWAIRESMTMGNQALAAGSGVEYKHCNVIFNANGTFTVESH